MPQQESCPELRDTRHTPLGRPRRSPTLQPTNSVPPLMQSRQRGLLLRRARASKPAVRSASGSANNFQTKFGSLYLTINGYAMMCAGWCLIASLFAMRRCHSFLGRTTEPHLTRLGVKTTSYFSAIMSNIWIRANQRKTRTQNHQNLTTVLLRLSKYWQILHRSATTSLQNAARNVKAENRRETAQSSWVCQVYRREKLLRV